MTCEHVQKLLDAYVDGELDLVHNLEIEQHLQDCVACQTTYQNHLVLKKTLKAKEFYYEVPAGLQKRLHTSLRQASLKPPTPTARILSGRWLVLTGSMAALLLLLVIGGFAFLVNSFSSNNDLMAQEVVSSHIRSLMVNHLADVASTDQHTVKPWFDGKLDFSPVVEDFASKGYPLIGGRLDYLDKQSVAALVYQRGKHVINVFIWRDKSNSKTELQIQSLQGYHLLHWSEAGSNYWAVSDLNESELKDFVQLIHAAVTG